VWVSRSEGDILAAIQAGNLIENAAFDAKAALPDKGRSKDLAKDVAAMANNGGVLLYGVGEDENHSPTVLKPFKLAGARERVDQIVWSSISEPPVIEIYPIPTENDPSIGYLVVVVPPSSRAPHMVTAGGDNRYYGRGATGNVQLPEREVARLYDRRQQQSETTRSTRLEIDPKVKLDEAVASAPVEPHEGYAFLHLVARPVVPDEELLEKARGDKRSPQFLRGLFSTAVSAEVYSIPYSPDLLEANNFEARVDGWVASQGLKDKLRRGVVDPGHVLEFEVGVDGSGHLFCGRAAEEYNGRLLIFENIVAGVTARFLAVMGGLYAAGGYVGPVDVGLAVTGLRGGISYVLSQRFGASPRPFDKDQYRRTNRYPAPMLRNDPRGAARKLVMPLVQAITRESYDPFSE
jgi:schlafen family protein